VAVRIVTGPFDPLLAGHTRRLSRVQDGPGALIVVVTTSGEQVLPVRARAELVAALSAVDYVVIPEDDDVENLLSRLPAVEVVREEAAHEALRQDLIRHVRTRQDTK
jgi:bifunctional ADP-heptose synthase (sugar kinase/adenylyltransferase)